ncbi:MAG: GYD domain-containing protein, partial [Pseudomonadota bacterium]
MGQYVMLLRYHSSGVKALRESPERMLAIHDSIERWECKVLQSYHLLGEYDHCLLVDAPDNFKAYRASLGQELSTTAD